MLFRQCPLLAPSVRGVRWYECVCVCVCVSVLCSGVCVCGVVFVLCVGVCVCVCARARAE